MERYKVTGEHKLHVRINSVECAGILEQNFCTVDETEKSVGYYY
jgi:hypothetical protein